MKVCEKISVFSCNETIHVMRVLYMSYIVNGFYSNRAILACRARLLFVAIRNDEVLNCNLIYGSIRHKIHEIKVTIDRVRVEKFDSFSHFDRPRKKCVFEYG